MNTVGKITKNPERRSNMFSKSEKKKSTAPLFLTVGALAVIGARSIVKKGKCLIDKMTCRRHSDKSAKGEEA